MIGKLFGWCSHKRCLLCFQIGFVVYTCLSRIFFFESRISNQYNEKDSADPVGCRLMEGPIYIYEKQVYGAVAFSDDGPETECLYVNFYGNMNISNTDPDRHQYYYSGNISANTTYVTSMITSQHLTTNPSQSIVENFTAALNMYPCDGITFFDITVCDAGSCDSIAFQGFYNVSSNSSCTELYLESIIQ